MPKEPLHYSPTRMPEAEAGEYPPYDVGRTLYFWFLYDWESRDKKLGLAPPPADYVYRPNEKLYRCKLDLDPPHLDKFDVIEASPILEEDATKEPLGKQSLAYYLARRFFVGVTYLMPPRAAGETRGFEVRFGRGTDFEAPEFTMRSPWGTHRVVVEEVPESKQEIPMADAVDELEQRVDVALKAAYRDGPEWMEVRAAVEALKIDRRARMQTTPAAVLDQVAETVGREAERAAEAIGKGTERVVGHAKTFASELQGALKRFADRLDEKP
jgi:hypothetical protein